MVFFLTSCARLVYQSEGKNPISFNRNFKHSNYIEVEEKKYFFLWGVYPDGYEINVDETLRFETSGLQIIEEVKYTDAIVSWLSLGLVMPRTIILKGYQP